jgi:hypothetical protein
MRSLLLLLLCLLSLTVHSQKPDWREVWQQWVTIEEAEENYGEETLELLEDWAASPINLNQTSREELEQLPFLSAGQIEELVEYLDRYHPMRSLSELMMITKLDRHTRKLLECFVYVGEEKAPRIWPQWKDIAKYGKHTFRVSAKIPLYERKGDENGYLGYRYRHDIRYQFNYNNRIKFGLTGAQDAGEPFFAYRNKLGYDHYSYYFQLRDMGRLEELNLGLYRVQMGMGLVMNTGFHLGKLATLQSLGRSTHTLTAHSSRTSATYLQGAAATIRIARQWRITGYVSWRGIDATLNNDGTMRTIVTNGYHRTPTEMDKKNNSHETDIGGSIGWRKQTLHININANYTRFERELVPPSSTLYRRYAAAGNNFFNASLDYGYNNYPWTIAGETAVNQRGAFATIHTVGLKTSDQLQLMLLHRYYDKRYTALHANSFSEGSGVQNEHGIYLGATWQPIQAWQIQGFVDYAHFSWLRYQISAPSDAFDALLSSRYDRKGWSLDARYRFHLRQRDNEEKTALVNKTEHRVRLGANYEVMKSLTLRTQADGILHQTKGVSSQGVMVSQHAKWQYHWLKTDVHVGWFRTDDYDSRIYQYEASLAYDFGYPMYYGHGLRYSLMVKADILKRLTATAKIGVTNYFDRSVIGTGLQQINHSSMTDLLMQIRYSF